MEQRKKQEVMGLVRLKHKRDGSGTFFTVWFTNGEEGFLYIESDKVKAAKADKNADNLVGRIVANNRPKQVVQASTGTKRAFSKPTATTPVAKPASTDTEYEF